MNKKVILLAACGLLLSACGGTTPTSSSASSAQTSASVTSEGNSSESSSSSESSIESSSSVSTVAISLSGDSSVLIGQSVTLTASVTGTSDTRVSWSSSDITIASVKNGVVSGVAVGDVTVTAASIADPSKSATLVVHVTAPTLNTAVFDALGDNFTSETTAETSQGELTSYQSVTDHGIYESLGDHGFYPVLGNYYYFEKKDTNYVYNNTSDGLLGSVEDVNKKYVLKDYFAGSDFHFSASQKGLDIFLSSRKEGAESDVALSTYIGDIAWIFDVAPLAETHTLSFAAILSGDTLVGCGLYGVATADPTDAGFFLTTVFSKIGQTTFDVKAYAFDEETSGGGEEEPFSSSSANLKMSFVSLNTLAR